MFESATELSHVPLSRNLQSSNIVVDFEGAEIYEWNEDVEINLSGSYDDTNPDEELNTSWVCPSTYSSFFCEKFDKLMQIPAIERIFVFGLYFGIPYEFFVTFSSPTSLDNKT